MAPGAEEFIQDDVPLLGRLQPLAGDEIFKDLTGSRHLRPFFENDYHE
jgi:hypothetical protein